MTLDARFDLDRAKAFIRANTTVLAPPHVPEVRLHLAAEAHDLWRLTEEELQERGLPPPYWAFAWAGGQGLARHLLDFPETVRGRRVLDFATGSGLVAIAALGAGARAAVAVDTDPWCGAAVALNAPLNRMDPAFCCIDMIGRDEGWEVVLAGDVFFDRELAARLVPWFAALRTRGAEVLIGDPGRAYLPRERLVPLAIHQVPVTRALEDSEVKRTTVWRFD